MDTCIVMSTGCKSFEILSPVLWISVDYVMRINQSYAPFAVIQFCSWIVDIIFLQDRQMVDASTGIG